MNLPPIAVEVGETSTIHAFLEERVYEYNAGKTGYHDGKTFAAQALDDAGGISGGVCGYTWGGCCYVSYLWLEASMRRQGIGKALLLAAEAHACQMGCTKVFVSTHSFQAPGFYERFGYTAEAVLRDHPIGYSSVTYSKTMSRSKNDGA